MLYTAEKALTDHKDAVSAEIKEAVEAKIKALKDVKDKDDNDAIKSKTQELSSEMQKIGEAMQKSASQTQPTGEENGSKPEDNIRDAEMGDEGKKQVKLAIHITLHYERLL